MRNKEIQPVNPLTDPIEQVVRTPDGRYGAKQIAAVIYASNQIANGVPTEYALKSAKDIFNQSGRKRIAELLQSARDLRRDK